MSVSPQVMQSALSGIGDALRSPVLKAAAKHLWLTIPLGLLAWSSWKAREKKGEATVHNLISDVTPAVTLAIGIITLNLMLEERAKAQAGAPKPVASRVVPAAAPAAAKTQDAEFTLNPPPEA